MVTVTDVTGFANELPDVTEGERHGNLTWWVGGKAFAWVRPFSKADIKRFGAAAPPEGPIVAVRVADQMEKEALLASSLPGFFTISHFDGYDALLIQLDEAKPRMYTMRSSTHGWRAHLQLWPTPTWRADPLL